MAIQAQSKSQPYKLGVYTLWRSGATAYCEHLASKHNLANLKEVFFSNAVTDPRRSFMKDIDLASATNLINSRLVFNVKPDQLPYQQCKELDCEWIMLERQDVEEQILSYLYAHASHLWHHQGTFNEKVHVDLGFIDYFAKHKRTFDHVKAASGWEVRTYENLDMSHASLRKIPKSYSELIANYDDAINYIHNRLS